MEPDQLIKMERFALVLSMEDTLRIELHEDSFDRGSFACATGGSKVEAQGRRALVWSRRRPLYIVVKLIDVLETLAVIAYCQWIAIRQAAANDSIQALLEIDVHRQGPEPV